MDMQEPEEQRLEDEPTELAENENGLSDEPALTDSDASEPDEVPAPDTPAVEAAEMASVEIESASDAPLSDDADAGLDEESTPVASMVEDVETDLAEGESVEESAPDASEGEDLETPVESELDEESTPATSLVEETETVSIKEESVEESPAEAPINEEDEETSVESKLDEESPSAEDEFEPTPEPDDDPSAWFVIHCYSGYENKVRHNLEQRIETMGMKDMIFDVIIPTQEEIEVRDGKRRTVERHIFPGYVLVNMILTEESWYVVRNTPGVTGFVGMGNNPTPLRPEEVSQIVKRMEADAPTVKVTFKVGERIRIVDGPFNDFRGVVAEIDMERTKVRVMVSFFGRETPVELDFLQVEKA